MTANTRFVQVGCDLRQEFIVRGDTGINADFLAILNTSAAVHRGTIVAFGDDIRGSKNASSVDNG